jgi:hypothetical protein
VNENAHPFTFGTVTGVHNGSLRDWWDLENYRTHDVDSKALIETIAARGIKETWKSFIGAAAVVWWDEDDSSINMVRNKERPLTYCWGKDRKTIFWASEFWMISVAASRAKIDLEKDKDGDIVYYNLSVNEAYKFDVKENGVTLTKKEPVTEKKPLGVVYGVNYGAGFKSSNNYTTKSWDFGDVPWANGLEKADKQFRGKTFTLNNKATVYRDQKWAEIFVGEIKGEQARVEIYPQTKKEYDKLSTHLQNRELVFSINARPRIFMGVPDSLRLAGGSVSFCKKKNEELKKEKQSELVEGYNGVLYLPSAMKARFRDAGGACVGCGETLVIEDASEYLWTHRDICLCGKCKEDKYILHMAQSA